MAATRKPRRPIRAMLEDHLDRAERGGASGGTLTAEDRKVIAGLLRSAGNDLEQADYVHLLTLVLAYWPKAVAFIRALLETPPKPQT